MAPRIEHTRDCVVRVERYDSEGNLMDGHCACGAITIHLMWSRSLIRTGSNVRLQGGHPWSGHLGRVVDWEFLDAHPAGSYPIVELMDGHRCFVLHEREVVNVPSTG